MSFFISKGASMDVVMSSKKILPCKSDQGKLNQNETLMTFKDTYLLIANARLILLQLAICPDLLKALDAITILLEGYDIGFMNYRPEVDIYVSMCVAIMVRYTLYIQVQGCSQHAGFYP